MACASALLASGAQVTLIDAGRDLAPERQTRREALAQLAPSEWSAADRAWLTSDLSQSGNSEPVKRLFGDDFMYAGAEWTIEGGLLPKGYGGRPSQALGGLSRVWGAALKRFDRQDLAAWPIPSGGLDRHYGEIERLMGQTLQNVSPDAALPFSPQTQKLLARWRMREAALRALGIMVSPARMAVAQRCRLCGMCLYGCPYGYIFSSDMFVRLYRDHPAFEYRAGLRAARIEEQGGSTQVFCTRDNGTQTMISADRVFVAAGVLGTARLMLASFGTREDRLTLHDSQRFLLPFLGLHAHPRHAPVHTLSQIFLEVEGSGMGAANVHVQVYSYNDFYPARIRAALGPLRRLAGPFADIVGRHFILAQGFMHSRDSGTAELRLTGPRTHPVLAIAPDVRERTRQVVRRIYARLGRAGRLAGMLPLTPVAEMAEVGAGYHSGAVFPMARAPRGWQSDALGRLRELARVHLVDASVLPEIPGGPVTLSIMANAHRIGAEAAALDQG
jgi:choline dehydrogenase-like flavoprotein